jgi:hypothetical protein
VHPVRGHYRKGKWVRPHVARNPGRRTRRIESAMPVGQARKKAGIVVTIVVIFAAGGSALGLGVSSLSGVSASSSNAASGTRPVGAEVYVEPQAGLRQTAAALVAAGYKVDLAMTLGTNCAAHSYGQVHEFFRLHPCKWLARAYIAVSESNQGLALVAVSWVGMPSAALAEMYKHLVDTSGTGNVTELSRDTGLYRKVRFGGEFYLSGMHGTSVWNAQAQPVESEPTAVIDAILNDSRQ